MKLPATSIHHIKRGLALPIGGAPEQRIEAGPPVDKVALVAGDFLGMRPRMKVQEGDAVERGQPIFEDRRAPGLLFVSPGAGTVEAVHRGDRRALLSVVIRFDKTETSGDSPKEISYKAFSGDPVEALDSGKVRELLLESGLWTALRERPFEKIPTPSSVPRAIIVTASDRHPLSPDPSVVLKGQEDQWRAGLIALTKLVPGGKVFVTVGPSFDLAPPNLDTVAFHEFRGPYPAGTPGLAMHRLCPVDRERVAWHVGYQEVAAIGHLLLTGKQPMERIVALAGPGVETPRLVKTRIGAPLAALVEGRLLGGDYRVISGSVMDGREAKGEITGYLGRYHRQITVLPEAHERRLLGWLAPGFDRFSALRVFASRLLPSKPTFSTDRHGGERAMVPLGLYEKVWPFDLLPTQVLRALLSNDIEAAEALGCLELAEEDVALLSFVCPSKIDYGAALRKMLDRIEEEG